MSFDPNCPDCGAHDYALYRASLQGCPHCLRAKYARAVNALQDIAALKAKPKTSGREIAIHALTMIGEARETG